MAGGERSPGVEGGGLLLEVEDLWKAYRIGGQTLQVLAGVDLAMREGEILSIVGQSGSGKSTLLHQIGLLDKPDRGSVRFRGHELPLGGPRAAYARNRHFGFVFQLYHLLPEFTALENVLMPAKILQDLGTYRRHRKETLDRARGLLERVGLQDRMQHRPRELSGGERQRVAIARGLMNRPAVLLCDEPTGNLDRHTAQGVKALLWDLNRTEGQSMIVVTHDTQLAADGHRTLLLVDGRLEPFEEAHTA